MKSLILLVLVFLLSGCYSSTRNISPNSRVDLTKGYLIASVGSGGGTADAFYVEGVDFKKKLYLSSGKTDLDPEKFNPYKNVKVVELKPGRYMLASWKAIVNQGMDTADYMPKNIKPIPFIIKPGKITYIGSLHITPIFKKAKVMSYGAGAYATISNKARRDISLAKRMYKNIKKLPVIYSNMPYGRWGIVEDKDAAPVLYIPLFL